MAEKAIDLSKLSEILDEVLLNKMVNDTNDFEARKAIRARLKEIREIRNAELDKKKKEADIAREEAVREKHRQAEEEKAKKLKEFQEKAKQPKIETNFAQNALKKEIADADKQKEKKLLAYKSIPTPGNSQKNDGVEESVSRTSKTETVGDGNKRTTTVTTTTTKVKDNEKTVTKQTKQITQVGAVGTAGSTYKITKQSADDVLERITNKLEQHSLPGTHGQVTVRTQHWNGQSGTTTSNERAKLWKAKTDDDVAKPSGQGVGVQRSATSIKQMLLDWCIAMTKEYDNIEIKNFSSSWNDGMAFCALIHHFYPMAFDYKKLNPKARRGNFKLAFLVAEKEAGIAPLLEVDDMVRMKNPDWKCVFTYIQSFYRRFRNWDQEQKQLLEKQKENDENKK